jgi:hypothetical protein
LLHRILSEPLPSIAARRNEPVAPELEELIRKACHPIPGQRFQSAQEMMLAIEALGRERGWVASQNEVSAFVEGLIGVDLDRRRQRIAQLMFEEGPTIATPGASRTSVAKSSARSQLALWGIAALVITIVGFLLLRLTRPEPTLKSTDALDLAKPSNPILTRPALVNNQGSQQLPAALPPASPPAVTPTPVAAEHASAPPHTENQSTAKQSAAKQLSEPARTTPAAKPAAPAKPAATDEPSPPDEIAPRNPYREPR